MTPFFKYLTIVNATLMKVVAFWTSNHDYLVQFHVKSNKEVTGTFATIKLLSDSARHAYPSVNLFSFANSGEIFNSSIPISIFALPSTMTIVADIQVPFSASANVHLS